MSEKDMRKKAAKIDYATVAFASLPFMGMISFWQVFDGIVPKMLTQTFGLSNAVTGFVMAIDNIFGLFLLPLFGILSDRCTSKLGRRTPFIIAGSVLAVTGTPLIAIANNVGSLALLISAIILTLVAICMYRTMTVAIVADITQRPLRMKTDSVKKLVGYAGTGVMLVCISAMVPKTEHPDYLPLFLVQAGMILVSLLLYLAKVREPKLVEEMHAKSLEMGIKEDEIEKDDSPEAGGKDKITDPDIQRSLVLLLAADFFYYMGYNAMTTNISRYADTFYGMQGGSFAIINIVTIIGALATYVPLANLSLRIGRKKVGLLCGAAMAACPVILWLVPGFHPAFYALFLVMGAGLGGVDLCVFNMILELCSARSVGRYSGYYYTVSMAAQVATPILSGLVMDVAPGALFLYIALMGLAMVISLALAKHGDAILIDEVAAREEKAEAH